MGWTNWEEINRLVSPADATVDNFGWPCYEGDARQPGYDSANLSLCETLYGQSNAVVAPHFKYSHGGPIIANEPCTIRGSSVTGLAFAPTSGGPYPSKYDGALFFADYSRNCIWAMRRGSGGLPSPAAVEVFGGAANPIDLQVGPGGNLYYVDLGGTVRRIEYDPAANRSPTAVATADPTEGEPPLTVSFDGTASSDPDGDNLNYEWDLDGDGAHDDSTDPSPTFTYDDRGEYAASLRVSDGAGGSDTDSVTIGVGRPDVTIVGPRAQPHLGGRRHDLVLGLGDRQRGRAHPRVRSIVVPRPAPRTVPGVPSAPGPDLRRRRRRIVPGARSRVPVLARAVPDRDRLERAGGGAERGPDAADDDAQPALRPDRA